MSGAYLGFASEDDYHANYVLQGLLETERGRAERRAIRAELKAIRSRAEAIRNDPR